MNGSWESVRDLTDETKRFRFSRFCLLNFRNFFSILIPSLSFCHLCQNADIKQKSLQHEPKGSHRTIRKEDVVRLFIQLIGLCVVCTLLMKGQTQPVHTYSIVVRDSVTGELGVAVQSHWFSDGSLIPWVEADIGAVATQSFVDPAYGPLGLELMRAGNTARQALDAIIASDPGRDVRQVAMIDARGNVAAHTGVKCIPAVGYIEGEQFTVQANLMLNDKVWPAMAKAYLETKGDLAVEKGDVEGALREYSTAEKMMPDNLEMKYWHAVALVNVGKLEEALSIFKFVFDTDANWVELTRRLPAVGLLRTNPAHPVDRKEGIKVNLVFRNVWLNRNPSL